MSIPRFTTLDLNNGVAVLDLGDGVEIAFAFPRDGAPGGMTRVIVGGVSLRDGRHPLFPQIASESGLVFERYHLIAASIIGDEAVLTLRTHARPDYYQEKPDVYYGAITTDEPDVPVTGELRWFVRAHRVSVRGESFIGFSYRHEFSTADVVVHHLLDRQSWEIGGSANGNTSINRGGYIKPEHTATRDSRHTTSEEFKRVGNRYFTYMQLRPRYGYVQCFDFQTGPLGSLLMYFQDVTAVRSLLHKESGRDRFQYFDDHWQAAGQHLSTTWRHVLFVASLGQDLWAGRNRWLRCWDFCAEHYRKQLGVSEGKPEFTISIGYWTRDMRHYRSFIDDISNIIPQVAGLGYSLWFLPLMQNSCMTSGHDVTSNLITCHNPCSSFDFSMATAIGGDAAVRTLVGRAREHGLNTMHWMGGHLANEAPDSPLFDEHPEWRVLGRDGVIYCSLARIIAAVDFNTPYAQHFSDEMEHWVKDLGITHLFCDSYPNYLLHVVNYADPSLRPNHEAALSVQARCAEWGAQWYVEGESPFGVSSCALAGPILGLGADTSINTENLHEMNWTLDNFVGERQYVLYKNALRASLSDVIDGTTTPELFFRLAAYQAPLGLFVEYKTGAAGTAFVNDRPDIIVSATTVAEHASNLLTRIPAAFATIMRTFNRVRGFMARVQILPNYHGSVWEDDAGDTRIVWCFSASSLALRTGESVVVELGEQPAVVCAEVLHLVAEQVYRLSRTRE